MKRSIILTLCTAILILTTNTWADFPCEEAWSIELDTATTVLGPSWQDENGQSFFLVGMADRVLMIGEDEIVWESPELPGQVTALNCVDFGVDDGLEIIAATIDADFGRIHIFNGDGFNEHNQYTLYYKYIDFDAYDFESNDDRYINTINILKDLLPDRRKMIVVGNTKQFCHETSYGHSSWGFGETCGGIISVSINNIRPMREGPARPGSILETKVIDSNNDGELELVCGSNQRNSNWNDNNWSSGQFRANLSVFDNELNELFSRQLAGYAWRERSNESKQVFLHSMEVLSISDSLSYVAVSYKDTSEYLLELLSLPDLETVESLTLRDQPIVDIQTYNTHDDDVEVFLICFDATGKLYTVGLDNFQIVDYIDNFASNFISSEVGNFDDDGDLEMAVLTQRSFTMYDLGTLSVPLSSEPLWIPASYAISAAYPNPFNSSTHLEYDIPQAGRIALSVYDLTGREIIKLTDGWRDVGRYNIVLDGDNLTSGVYLISLDAGDEKVVRKVQLLK